MLHLTEKWNNALDRGLKVGVLFIDFRKTFDTVNHTILLEKLKAIGTCISGDLLSWLDDYMSAQKQFVQFSGYQSRSNTITYGVPQGSIIGSQLFSFFVNDLPESITSGDLFMFADDTTIICRLCRKQYTHSGVWHMCYVDFVLVSLELPQCDLECYKEHEPLLVVLCV